MGSWQSPACLLTVLTVLTLASTRLPADSADVGSHPLTARAAQAGAPRSRPNAFAPHANEYFWRLLGGLQGAPLGPPARRVASLSVVLLSTVRSQIVASEHRSLVFDVYHS